LKIEIKNYGKGWRYNIIYLNYRQKQFDYVFKYLDFDKLDKNRLMSFNDKKTEEWFHKTYTNYYCLESICNNSLDGYKWLKNNWGNGVFKIAIWYSDKQELKTIVNKVINIKLIRGK